MLHIPAHPRGASLHRHPCAMSRRPHNSGSPNSMACTRAGGRRTSDVRGQGQEADSTPDGRLRVSQLVTTFGPGAMVDLLDHAVLIGGLEYWRYDSKQPRPAIDEDRLREAVLPRMKLLGLNLSRENAFMTGPPGDDDNSGPWNGIQVAEFPHWFALTMSQEWLPATEQPSVMASCHFHSPRAAPRLSRLRTPRASDDAGSATWRTR